MTTGADPTLSGPLDRGRAAARPLAFGFLMGSADLVPGVSGGTIALVVGIYERLVANVRTGAASLAALLRVDATGALRHVREVEWRWLLLLFTGVGAAVVALSRGLERLLETNPVELSAAFAGLVAGSVVVAAGDVRHWNPPKLTIATIIAVVFFALLGLRPGTVADPSLPVFFVAGALAVCAMILPGVSGSFLLLMFGMYEPVIAAISDRDVVVAATVALGAAVGLGSFSTLLSWVLRRWHDRVLAALVGLMVGSARVLWPWPAGEDGVGDTALGAPVASEVPVAAALFVVGLVVVVGISRAARGPRPVTAGS